MYLAGMGISVVVVGASAAMPDDARLAVWALFVIGWVVGFIALERFQIAGTDLGITPTDSLVERFGLFTIIVLGEVVVGVVEGIRKASGRHSSSLRA